MSARVGNHVTEAGSPIGYRGERYLEGKTPAGGAVPLGNEVAGNVGKGGPGTGRTCTEWKPQGMPVTPQPIGPTKDTLAEFGPDSAERAQQAVGAMTDELKRKALSDQQVAEVLQMLHEGKSQARVAEHFGVSRSAISDIALRKTRTSVPGPRPEKRTYISHRTGDGG